MDFYAFTQDKEPCLSTTDMKKEFGTKLKRLRKLKGLTIDQIVEDYPISKPTIIRLERGEGNLSFLFVYLKAIDQLDNFMKDAFRSVLLRQDILNA